MTKTWNIVNRVWLLLALAAAILWGTALLYGFFDGSISGIRAGLKLLMIVGVLFWLYDRWTSIADK